MGMQLRSQHLAEILAALSGHTRTGGGAENRRATRITVAAKVTLWPLEENAPGEPRTVLARDISHSGIGMLWTRPAVVGGQCIARLPRAKGEPLLVLCQITQCRPLADDLYQVGAEFVSILTDRDPTAREPSPLPKGVPMGTG